MNTRTYREVAMQGIHFMSRSEASGHVRGSSLHPMNSPATAELMHPILFPPTASIYAEDLNFWMLERQRQHPPTKEPVLLGDPNPAALKLDMINSDVCEPGIVYAGSGRGGLLQPELLGRW